jgi:hypothetical protein
MQYLRRSPEVLHLRVGYGLPEGRPGALPSARSGSNAAPVSASTGADAARAWVAVAELEWSALDDAAAALRKLRGLQASIHADQPKARNLASPLSACRARRAALHAQPRDASPPLRGAGGGGGG